QYTFTTIQVLRYHSIILHLQPANRHCHPAVLVAMVVHRAGLAHLPADCKQLVEWCLVYEVASVVLPVPGEIGRQSLGRDRSTLQKSKNFVCTVECRCRELSQAGDKSRDCNLFGYNRRSHFTSILPLLLELPRFPLLQTSPSSQPQYADQSHTLSDFQR